MMLGDGAVVFVVVVVVDGAVVLVVVVGTVVVEVVGVVTVEVAGATVDVVVVTEHPAVTSIATRASRRIAEV
jgi:hypothetical protein